MIKTIKHLINNNKSTVKLYKSFFTSPIELTKAFSNIFLSYFLKAKVHPLNVNFSITNKCNNLCSMCFENISNKKNEMNSKEILNALRGMPKYTLIFISGGEPFCREDVFEIIKNFKNKFPHVGICTNGSMLDRNKILRLSSLNLDNVIFSLHGNRISHDKITGIKGSYDKTFHNIQFINSIRNKTYIMINSVLHEKNIDNMNEMIFSLQKIEADEIRFEHLSFLRNRETNTGSKFLKNEFAIQNFISDDDYQNFSKKVIKFVNRYKKRYMFKPDLDTKNIKSWYKRSYGLNSKCIAPWSSVFIASDGEVYPCQTIRYSFGNVKNNTLFEIFNSKRANRFRSKIKKGLFPCCARCCKL